MYLHTPNIRLLDTFNAPGSVGIILITYKSKIRHLSPMVNLFDSEKKTDPLKGHLL